MGIYLWAGWAVIIIIFLSVFLFILWKITHKALAFYYVIFPIIILLGYTLLYYHNKPDEFEKTLSKNSVFCDVSGTIDKVQKTDYGYKLWLKKVHVNFYGKEIKTGNTVVYADAKYQKGDKVSVYGECELFNRATNPGEFDTFYYYKSLKVDYRVSADHIELYKKNDNYLYSLSDAIKEKINTSFYNIADDKYASVLSAMLLGNKDELDEGINDLFSGGGIGHILAISGMHISIIGMGFYKIIKRAGMGYMPAMIISGGFILFYGMLTGNGISTVRAIIMFMLAVYSNVVGRTYDMVSAACLAGTLMLIDSPMLIYNGGFWLSFMAIAGIGGINPAIIKMFDVKNSIIKALIGGISVSLGTLPVIMYLYYEIPVYSFIINLIVVPLVTYVMLGALIGGCLGCFNEMLGSFVVGIAVYILKLYEFLCEKSLGLWGAIWICGKPMLWQVFMYYGILWLFLWIGIKKSEKRYICCVLLAVAIIIFRFNNSFEAVFLNVGQGDGIFIRSDNRAILVDGGSSDNSSLYEYTLEPFLMSEGVDCIDYAFITHADTDHCSGIKELLKKNKLKIKILVLPYMEKKDDAYTEIEELCKKTDTKIIYVSSGQELKLDKLVITCLHPAVDYRSEDRNSYSTVLLFSRDNFNMLLTGDISEKEEKLLKTVPKLDVLKVAHHGSKYSSSEEFLKRVNPDFAIISCGEGNTYGHPHIEAVERLRAVNSKVFITMDRGAVIVEQRDKLRVYGFAK